MTSSSRLVAPSEDGEVAPHSVVEPPRARTVADMFRAACVKYGGRIAFQAHSKGGQYDRLSFTELGERADGFAATLLSLGLQAGDRVGIVCENRLEWPIAYYGIVIAGGVAVPIYTELPASEIGRLLTRAGARFLVSSDDALCDFHASPANVERVFAVGEVAAATTASPAVDPANRQIVPFDHASRGDATERARLHGVVVKPDDLASIVFTSGTTGGPKGVMLTHRNFMANVSAAAQVMAVGPSDRLLLALPLHHAFPFAVGVLLAVAVGGEVTLERDPLRIRQRLIETRPTVFLGVPALFEIMHRNVERRIEGMGRAKQFARALGIAQWIRSATGINIGRLLFRQVHRQLGGSLRFMFSGGSALNPEIARQFMLLGIPLLQGWGLTETAPVVTVQRWSPWRFYFTRHYERRLGSAGQPLPGVDVDIIDVPEKDLFVNVDGEGELIVRGDNVTPGYWQADDVTREAKMGEWFKTGDLGRIDREGNVWITGRRKYVIVLDSGEKVHPDEVEAALALSPLIEDVSVVPRSIRGRPRICAVIYPAVEATLDAVGRAGLPVDEAGVRRAIAGEIERLQHELAAHKRPSVVLISDAPLPKTAIRKVAREQLRDSYDFSFETWIASKREEPTEEPA